MSEATLKNLRILELNAGIAGAYCAKILAQRGAEVIKLEAPGSKFNGSAENLYLDTAKKSITINLRNEMGIGMFQRLVSMTDVLIEGCNPSEKSEIGLDANSLTQNNPRLVITSVTGFGQTGPYSNYKDTPMVSYAMGGQMYLCGDAEGTPLNSGVAVSEYISGLYAFIGTLLALEAREKNGRGQQVDISKMECLAASHQYTLTWPEYSNSILSRPGWPGDHAPQSLFRCKDGYVNLRLQNADIAFLSYLFDMPEVASDERFAATHERANHMKELEKLITDKIINIGKKDVFRKAGEWREICGFVATPADLLTNEQYNEREYWTKINHGMTGVMSYSGMPAKMSESAWLSSGAPLPGENNQEIYCDRLGLTWQELKQMQEWSVI
ncbi:MAG TPA: CoA transferase [Dehalococcoidales bacterium]|nr:CoA transferase [Dehalococcoidales bacterium]